jgi:hypothetical protein
MKRVENDLTDYALILLFVALLAIASTANLFLGGANLLLH